MKTLKITFATLALLVVTFVSQASVKTPKLSMTETANAYINAFANGKIDGFAELLDDNVKLTMSRGSNILNYTKTDILKMLNDNKGVVQNCKTDYSVIENLPTQVILKVNMKYDLFSKINYVTMSQTDKGWKVTNISSAYQQ